ncbi:hypothetical protein ABH926_005298 [Catenulispora sp. GP43]|uniref:hypothetical protein n=1 Tax=Catenulispora sp. GP43 TaxID=3156263 RepID=UPI003517D684
MAGAGTDVDWAKLIHAFGAATNIPSYITDWRGANLRRKLDADNYLRMAGFAYGLWPATAPITLTLLDFLDGPDIDGDDAYLPLLFIDRIAHQCDRGDDAGAVGAAVTSHAAEIASWISAYAEADHHGQGRLRDDGSGLADLVNARSRLECFDLIPRLLPAVLPWMHDGRIRRRAWIAATITAMARHPGLADQRSALQATIERTASAESDPHELSTLLIALGDLGGKPSAWLDHQHVGVRISAAIALGLAGDDAAAPVLRKAAREPAAYFASFGDMAPPGQFMTPPHGRDVLSEALRRIEDGLDRATDLAAPARRTNS